MYKNELELYRAMAQLGLKYFVCVDRSMFSTILRHTKVTRKSSVYPLTH